MNPRILKTQTAGFPSPAEPFQLSDRVCPVRIAPLLDNPLRRWLTGTRKIAQSYLRPGMTVLDVGCGPAPMLMDIAQVIGPSGTIICADVQRGMLDHVARKATRKRLACSLRVHLCRPETLGLEPGIADFAVAFWMMHEAPDLRNLTDQITTVLKPEGRFLVIEPGMHVSEDEFRGTISLCLERGMELVDTPRIRLSRAALFEKPGRKS